MLEKERSTVVYDVECMATEWFIMLNGGLHSGLSCWLEDYRVVYNVEWRATQWFIMLIGGLQSGL